MDNYYTTGKIAPSIYSMMAQAGTYKLSQMSSLYALQTRKDLEEIQRAKERLQQSLGNYMTVLERMVLAENMGAASGVQMASLIGSGRIDLNFMANQGFSYDGWGITSKSLEDALYRYQIAVSKGQHNLNKMLENITGGKMFYKIAVAGDSSKEAPVEFTLNLDQVYRMETDRAMFNIGVSGSQLQKALMTGDYSTLSFSQHTNKVNLKTGEIITNSVMRKYLGQLTGTRGKTLDTQQWNFASHFKREESPGQNVRPSDAYEIYTSLRNGVIDEGQFEGIKKRLWKHDSSPGIVGGDVNFINAQNQFRMIQNKFFNQARGPYARTNEETALYQQWHGFFSYSNLNNIEQGLYAYLYGFENPIYNWDGLSKGSHLTDTVAERVREHARNEFASSWEQDVGWTE